MGYEFNSSENAIFENAASFMRVVGIAAGIWGLLVIVGALRSGIMMLLVDGGVKIVVAFLLIKTSQAFRNIIETKGDDIEHAMEAIKALRSYFFVQAASLLITLGSDWLQ